MVLVHFSVFCFIHPPPQVRSDLKMIRSVITASLPWSSTIFICRVSHRLCPCSPVCISTDRLFVHLELSAPTEHKRTHQKTLWGCFSSLKLGFSSQPSWAEVKSANQYEQSSAYSCSTSSILETDRCRSWMLSTPRRS